LINKLSFQFLGVQIHRECLSCQLLNDAAKMNRVCPSVPLDLANLLVCNPEEPDGLLGKLTLWNKSVVVGGI
jgi:hypothetical protein